MSKPIPMDAVIVSKEAFDEDEPCEIVLSNMSVVAMHLGNHFNHNELARDAMRAHVVEAFYGEVQNGGFAQFAYNFDWGEHLDYLLEGFELVGASKHLGLFEKIAEKLLEPEGLAKLQALLQSDFFDENPERDEINEMGDGFFDLEETEYLEGLTSKWLRSLPNLVVLPESEIESIVKQRAEALPDLDARIQHAKDHAPRFEKLINALCEEAGQTLEAITAGDPSHQHEGEDVIAWHFITDQGHHHMVEFDGKSIMFKGDSSQVVCEIEAGPEYGAG